MSTENLKEFTFEKFIYRKSNKEIYTVSCSPSVLAKEAKKRDCWHTATYKNNHIENGDGETEFELIKIEPKSEE